MRQAAAARVLGVGVCCLLAIAPAPGAAPPPRSQSSVGSSTAELPRFPDAGGRWVRAVLPGQAPQAPARTSLGVAPKRTALLPLPKEVLGDQNLIDLDGRTLHFTPAAGGFVLQAGPLDWDADAGSSIGSAPVDLGIAFPYGGKTRSKVTVNPWGVLTFDDLTQDDFVVRFFAMRDVAGSMLEVPVIAALFHKFSDSRRFISRRADRVVITWDAADWWADALGFSNTRAANRFQAVLYADGKIDLSYDGLAVQDGVVGLFPGTMDLSGGDALAAAADGADGSIPAHLDIREATVSAVADGTVLRVTLKMAGSVPTSGASLQSLFYRGWVDIDRPLMPGIDFADGGDLFWQVGGAQLNASGNGVFGDAEVKGNTVSWFVFADALDGVEEFAIFFDAADFDAAKFDDVGPFIVRMDGVGAEVDLSAGVSAAQGGRRSAATRSLLYEAFHYRRTPSAATMACAAIAALGDQYEQMAFYSDFRPDHPEAGSNSTGPISGAVGGIGAEGAANAALCSSQLHVTYTNPIWIHGPAAQKSGVNLAGPFKAYNSQVALMAHELGHGFAAFVDGPGGMELGDGSHWREGLNTEAAFDVGARTGGSIMGGRHYTANGDGTFGGAAEHWQSPAGYSWLDLYLMGLALPQEVPNFFLLQGLQGIGGGNYAGSPLQVTVGDVIAANGPRTPAWDGKPRTFDTLVVGFYVQGDKPSKALKKGIAGIRRAYDKHLRQATLGRARLH